MNSSLLIHIVSILVLATAGYFLVDVIFPDLSSATALAGGVVGGGVVNLLLSLFVSKEVSPQTGTTDNLSTLYVGNLPYRANEQAVQEHFESYGKVNSVRLMKDRRTGKRKGYGFVEMDSNGAVKAINELNDSVFQERTLKVRLAKDKAEEEQ